VRYQVITPVTMTEDDCLLGCCPEWGILMVETVRTSETSVNFYQSTRRTISEDSHLYVYITSHVHKIEDVSHCRHIVLIYFRQKGP
jgi:hypothetical protein